MISKPIYKFYLAIKQPEDLDMAREELFKAHELIIDANPAINKHDLFIDCLWENPHLKAGYKTWEDTPLHRRPGFSEAITSSTKSITILTMIKYVSSSQNQACKRIITGKGYAIIAEPTTRA